MEKYFKRNEKTENEMFVVENVNAYPVKAVCRVGNPLVTNVSVDKYWDCLTTYDVAIELVKQFDEVFGEHDLGLCSYLAQCIVNPMWEAKTETRVSVCDMTMIFGYDFELHDGKMVYSIDIWKVLTPYITIVDWKQHEYGVEMLAELNVK